MHFCSPRITLWSMARRLTSCCGIFRLFIMRIPGRRSSLETLTSRYCDYANWQRERLDGQMLEELLGYWKRKLAGAGAESVPDRPVSASPFGPGATHRFYFPVRIYRGLLGC